MIAINNNIARDKEVSSVETREFQDNVRYELSSLYHRSLALTSELNAISAMVTLTEKSTIPLLRDYINQIDNSSSDILITSSSERTDPESLQDIERAESHIEYGCICSKRVESINVFTHEDGSLKNYISVSRSTLNGITEEAPDAIIENNAKHIFDTRIPYIIKFKKPNLQKSSIYLDISSNSIPIKLNALRFIPYPGVGSLIIDGIWKDGSTGVNSTNNSKFNTTTKSSIDIDTNYDKFTMPGYIHTEVVSTANLRLGFSSKRYITEMGGIVIGIGSLIGELNVYSQNSFAGFTLDIPSGKVLDSIEIIPDVYYQNNDNISVSVYDDITYFNNMHSNYQKRCKDKAYDLNIAPDGNGKLYILVELNSINNISPSLSKILVRYK